MEEAQSPDLSPMEVVWDELNRRLKQRNLQVQTISGDLCHSIWTNLLNTL